MRSRFIVPMLLVCAGCEPSSPGHSEDAQGSPAKVKTSGKVPTALGKVPPEVLAAAKAAQPTMSVTEAEAEVREGRNYYDVAGRLPDGSEIELDMLQQPQGWTVVETQRDIDFAAVPQQVRAAAAKAHASFKPVRVIESRQSDGIVIYELFGPAPASGEGRKIEVKFDGATAEVLTKEWAH